MGGFGQADRKRMRKAINILLACYFHTSTMPPTRTKKEPRRRSPTGTKIESWATETAAKRLGDFLRASLLWMLSRKYIPDSAGECKKTLTSSIERSENRIITIFL